MVSSKKSLSRQRRVATRRITANKIRKLQRAGLLSDRIRPNTKPSKYTLSQLYKYRAVISGKDAAVKLHSVKKAREFRERQGGGGRGKTVIITREKGERFKVSKDDVITSTRNAYGYVVEKIVGDKWRPPAPGEKVYYTISLRRHGLGRLKRHTFASAEEMLYTFSKYDIDFNDVQDFIEVERFKEGSRRERQVRSEYLAARRRLARKKKRGRRRYGTRGRRK